MDNDKLKNDYQTKENNGKCETENKVDLEPSPKSNENLTAFDTDISVNEFIKDAFGGDVEDYSPYGIEEQDAMKKEALQNSKERVAKKAEKTAPKKNKKNTKKQEIFQVKNTLEKLAQIVDQKNILENLMMEI